MNDELSHFEDQLRRVTPASCDQLKDNTMYRAGWNAAHAAMAMRGQSSIKQRRPITAFASGLVCGLLVFVMNTTTSRFAKNESASVHEAVIATNELPVTSPAEQKTSDVRSQIDETKETPPAALHHGALTSLSTMLWPWLESQPVNFCSDAPQATRPLSPAARYQWSSLVLNEPASVSGNHAPDVVAAEVHAPLSLTTRPSTDMTIDELL